MIKNAQKLGRRRRLVATLGVLAAVGSSLVAAAPASAQTTINFSNLETVLAEPDNTDAKMLALWAGFFTQVYEYSMPFVEISIDEEDAPVSEFRMTIGDSAFQFSDEFQNVHFTNSTATEQPGGYARLGQSSSAGVDFTSSVDDGGDTLVLDFGPGGLQPGETVRFQIDIDPDDPGAPDPFPSYTSVLFDANEDPGDDADNAAITLLRDGELPLMLTLPDFDVDPNTLPTPGNPRVYSVMQTVDPIEPQTLIVIPEPAAAGLALLAVCGVAAARRRAGV